MSVRIRLRRMGAKKQPFYRVVVADSRSPRDGRFLDTIGTYNPRAEPVAIDINREKTLKWLEEGALPTASARSLLSQAGIWQEFKTGVAAEPGQTPAVAERPAEVAPDEQDETSAESVGEQMGAGEQTGEE